MFLHSFKYAMITTLRNKTTLVWTLLFPIALATFMYMSFGNLFEEELLKNIDIAVVKEVENEPFITLLEDLSLDTENKIFNMQIMDEKDALKELEDDKIGAIIYVKDDISIKVSKNSYEATVVKTIVEEYKKSELIVNDLVANNPTAVDKVVENLQNDKIFFTKSITSDGNQDVYTNFFYAIFAMSCMFASFIACEKIQKMQVNISSLGMRRCLSPNSKMITIIAEFLSMLIFQFLVEIITLVYMMALGVDFGDKYLQIIILLFFGSCIGISIGIIAGSMSNLSKNAREGICVAVGLVSSALSDLMVSGVKYSIEQKMPIINRLNPSALIVDSFYALNIYDTYERYTQNIIILAIMAAVMLIISFFLLSKSKVSSIQFSE